MKRIARFLRAFGARSLTGGLAIEPLWNSEASATGSFSRTGPAPHASAVHSRFCERLHGEDLCQEGLTDMAALGDLLARLDLKPGDHTLDLDCGVGIIAE